MKLGLYVMLSLVLMSCGFFQSRSNKINNEKYVIETSIGNIEVELYPSKAPISVANFKRYVERGDFSESQFFRVVRMDNQPNDSIKIEVVQGKFASEDGYLPPVAHETTEQTGIKHEDGTLSLARFGPGTASAHFFICVNDQPELDFGGHRNPDGQGFAAFGKVTKGMDIVRKIQTLPAEGQTLVDPIPIKNVSLLR